MKQGRAEAFVSDRCSATIAYHVSKERMAGNATLHDHADGSQALWVETEGAKDGRYSLPKQAHIYVLK